MSSELDCKVNFRLNLLEINSKTDQLVRLFFRNVRGITDIKLQLHALIERWTMFQVIPEYTIGLITSTPTREKVVMSELTQVSENQSCNKHLMTGSKGNSEFCFPETLNVVLHLPAPN